MLTMRLMILELSSEEEKCQPVCYYKRTKKAGSHKVIVEINKKHAIHMHICGMINSVMNIPPRITNN